jgi:UDP-glucose 4-epimerase
MKLLITGALGHIGSRFIHSLQPDEYEEVVLLDNLSTQRYCSLFDLPSGVRFRFVEDDVCTAGLDKYMAGVDVVIHLAAITNAAGSFEIQDQVERVNFEGTERVAQACVASGCRLIFLSTTSVYGTQEAVVDESCRDGLQPQSPYAVTKLRAEELLQALGQNYGLRFVACRFGTIFGTSIGMRFHTAVNKFCWQASLGQPLTVWRTALHQKRPYLELGDAVRALDFIVKTDRFDNQLYNVLTQNATVGQIVDHIRTSIPEVMVQHVDSRIMNQLSYEVSCDKFRALGFQFTGTLAAGIRETCDLIRGLRQSSSNS